MTNPDGGVRVTHFPGAASQTPAGADRFKGAPDASHAPPGVQALAAKAKEYTVIVAVRQGADGREFLMVRHRERGWELPGGKIEPNEGPVHCALREFREETGHLLGAPHFVMKLKKPNGTCFVFTGGLGPAVEAHDPGDGEFIEEKEWFSKLPRDRKLAFPDDPYEEIGAKLGIDFG